MRIVDPRAGRAGSLALVLVTLACHRSIDGESQLSGGATEPDTGDTAEPGAPDTGDTGDTEEPGALGAACALDPAPTGRRLDLHNAGCASQMCVFADELGADVPESCTQRSDCDEEGLGRMTCDVATGACIPDPAYIAERSMCATACDTHADCVVEGDTACVLGFSCVPVVTAERDCCQRVCMCNDDLGAWVNLDVACEDTPQGPCG